MKLSNEIKNFSGMGCFNDGEDNHYKNREYCRDINCLTQSMIVSASSKEEKETAKNICREHCSAYDFHKWLKENDYIIRGKK
jgi:hypothetical protein